MTFKFNAQKTLLMDAEVNNSLMEEFLDALYQG